MNKNRFSKRVTAAIVFAAVVLLFTLVFGAYIYRNVYKNHYVEFTSPAPQADVSDIDDDTVSHYYVHSNGQDLEDFASGLYSTPAFDESGIPLVDYGAKAGKQYNPTTICQYALGNWERFLATNDKRYYDAFLKQADWLAANQENGRWYYRFDWQAHVLLKNPWASSIAQGQGISVLTRAFQSTNDKKYLEKAEAAFAVLTAPIVAGGLASASDKGVWYEEYPSAEKPSRVFNGHIWTLFGIWDLYRATGDTRTRKAFEDGVAVVKAEIAKYDTGYWVLYEQQRFFLIDTLYMNLVIEELKALHAITGEPVFLDYAARWETYRKETGFSTILWHSIFEDKLKRLLN
jgi:rhamnogalacturonyl hydrolase YesR